MFHIVLKNYMVKLKTNFNAFKGHISIEGALRRPLTYDGHTYMNMNMNIPMNELFFIFIAAHSGPQEHSYVKE